jgi:hypothetical protein
VLALRQAGGELDAQTIRQEGERLVREVTQVLAEHTVYAAWQDERARAEALVGQNIQLQSALNDRTRAEATQRQLAAKRKQAEDVLGNLVTRGESSR